MGATALISPYKNKKNKSKIRRPTMFLAYDIKNGKQYAKLVKSIRKGAKVEKSYIYLGLVLNKEEGIYKNRKNGIFKYDAATNTYDYNPKWDGKVDVPSEMIKPWVKSKREQNAFIEGQADERERINRLNAVLIENNRYDDLKRSTVDEVFQAQLLAELVSEGVHC
jgi:hypothetical protein